MDREVVYSPNKFYFVIKEIVSSHQLQKYYFFHEKIHGNIRKNSWKF